MSSYFGWLDYSERERRRNLDVIDLFREKDTRDEMGIGVIRDAFADLLFPGTSTIQTRARYFLFIPWIYSRLEHREISSAQFEERARREEIRLIEALKQSEDQDGIIGSRAGRSLKRLPSSIYWQGLGSWAIRAFEGSQAQYYRSLDKYYVMTKSRSFSDDGDSLGRNLYNWRPSFPDPPRNFPQNASFELRPHEAIYLRDLVLSEHPKSLLAVLLNDNGQTEHADFPWHLTLAHHLPTELGSILLHAEQFSITMHGSALLYNLLLAEAISSEAKIDEYRIHLANWHEQMERGHTHISGWDRHQFWSILYKNGARIPTPTRNFVDRWIDFAVNDPFSVKEMERARDLVRNREYSLKRGHARLQNQRALELWSGAAGAAQLDYRWHTVRTIVQDIKEGSKKGETNA